MKHSHYKKSVDGLKVVDVYRVLQLFGVTDQALGHAIKKLLVAGGRGVKDIGQDVQEAIDTLERWQEMQRETLPDVAVRNQPYAVQVAAGICRVSNCLRYAVTPDGLCEYHREPEA